MAARAGTALAIRTLSEAGVAGQVKLPEEVDKLATRAYAKISAFSQAKKGACLSLTKQEAAAYMYATGTVLIVLQNSGLEPVYLKTIENAFGVNRGAEILNGFRQFAQALSEFVKPGSVPSETKDTL